MGVMDHLLLEQPPMILTPCPVTLDGQRFIQAEIVKGESLAQFLGRNVDLGADAWEVKIGGVVVPVEMWDRVKPKHGHVIEVRGAVNKQALYIVAMIALIWFTGGLGAGAAGSIGASGIGGVMFGAGTLGAMAANAAIFMAGAMIINKVLGPKLDKPAAQERDSVYNIQGARNSLRQYEPLGLLFGSMRFAPDILSMPYSWYEGNEQYLGMVLTPGINVHSFDPLYIGDTLLSEYEGVQVYTAGFPGMPEQEIPIYSNADTVAGGELDSSGTWVVRTTSPDTVRVMVNIEYLLGDMDSKGKPKYNSERVEVEYRKAGTSAPWLPLNSRQYYNNTYDGKRDTIGAFVPKDQYDIRVRRLGYAIDYSNGQANFQFTSLTSVQADDADYRGIPRIGIKIKATGQLNGTPDQIRAEFHANPMPFWTGTAWTTAVGRQLANPGAQILAYARGMRDENGDLIAGMGLADGMIDIPALQAFMRHCDANGYTYDHWQQATRSHAEVLDSIALAGFGQVTFSAGRLSVVWAADSQPLSGVVNMATIKKGQFQVDYTLANAADGVEYTYFDRSDWQTKTLRVAAPGVEVMLNPARLSGEGVTTEEHAAEAARYHMAQHLYQFKDISYSTDLEHLTYRRMSVLSLAHDMTKWAHGGRVQAVDITAGVVTVELDEPVPAPATGDAYIGIRIPGERVFRVLKVAPFVGESSVLTLVDHWPSDAPVPGASGTNPAHDSIWVYDFKATPGYRVRVVSIEPESGLKGARVAVVPESPEFWTYVKTGKYQPPVIVPPIDAHPVVSNLTISERQVVQGNTEYTELVATFDVSGYVSNCVVYSAPIGRPLEEVAQTTTRTAKWRIEEPGEYAVVVRPFDEHGMAGESASGSYVTSRADIPPPVFDWFEVQELPGGVRAYQWGYYGGTTQPANLAGAEIRVYEGNDAGATWDEMEPLGDGDGFFTSPFEMVIPPAGIYTFGIRARNTSGTLSTDTLSIVRTLSGNLGQVIDSIFSDVAADFAAVNARVDSIAAQVSDIIGAEEWSASETYAIGDLVKRLGKMYRAIAANTNQPPESNPDDWQLIGEYSSLGEAVAAAITIGTQNTSDIAAEATRLDAVAARMPSGTGLLATSAMVATESTARSTGDTALATQLNVVRASIDETFTASHGWQFIETFNGFFASNAVLSFFPATVHFGATVVEATASDPIFYSPGVSISGARNPIVRAMVRRRTNSAWEGRLLWGDPSSAYEGTYSALGNVVPALDVWTVVEWDLTGNPEWRNATIPALMFEFSPDAGSVVDVRWIVVGDKGPGMAASAAQELSAEVDGIDGRMRAKHTVALNVNGYVTGTVNENDGEAGEFTIMADRFKVVTPGATPKTPFAMDANNLYLNVDLHMGNGKVISRSDGYMNVEGIGFGVGNEFIEWFGPEIPIHLCSRGNAITYKTKTGAFYAKQIFTGARTFSAYTTYAGGGNQVSLNVTEVAGGTITVDLGYTYRVTRRPGHANQTLGPGAGVSAAQVRLYRKIGEAAETLVGTYDFTGGVQHFGEPGLDAISYCTGSATYSDTSGGLAEKRFRAEVASASLQDVAVVSGSATPGPITFAAAGNLSITSTE